jgi:hypothetical protein
MNKEIRELVTIALKPKEVNQVKVEISVIDKKEAAFLKSKTGFDFTGYKRIIDNYGIKHTLKEHGKESTEKPRGQIAVTKEDFELIPEIVKTENVIFSGKNKHGKNCILYEAEFNNVFFYVEEIRTGKKELALNTMYKRKPTRKGWLF